MDEDAVGLQMEVKLLRHVRERARREKGYVLAVLEPVVPPRANRRWRLRDKEGREKESVAARQDSGERWHRIDKVLEDLDGSHQIVTVSAVEVSLESLREAILAFLVRPSKVKTVVAHHPNKQSIAGAKIEKSSIAIQEKVDQISDHAREGDAPTNQSYVAIRDGGGIGVGEPIWFFGFHKATVVAPVIPDVVSTDNSCLPERVGHLGADSAGGRVAGDTVTRHLASLLDINSAVCSPNRFHANWRARTRPASTRAFRSAVSMYAI